MKFQKLGGLVLGLSSLSIASVGLCHETYSVTPLWTLNSTGSECRAYGLSSNGLAAGHNGGSSFLWNGSAISNVGAPPGSIQVRAFAVNSQGVVVGQSRGSGFLFYPFIWDAAGGSRTLQLLPGKVAGGAFAIAENGQIAGVSGYEGAGPVAGEATLWLDEQTCIGLGFVPGTVLSTAQGMNEIGDVVGLCNGGERAFIWNQATGMVELQQMPSPSLEAVAWDINNHRVAVGISHTNFVMGRRAVRWLSPSQVEVLGTLDPANLNPMSWAFGINDDGVIVGTSSADMVGQRAFVWTENEGMLNLNDLLDLSGQGCRLFSAEEINNSGQIVGWGHKDGFTRAFLLTPVRGPQTIFPVSYSVVQGLDRTPSLSAILFSDDVRIQINAPINLNYESIVDFRGFSQQINPHRLSFRIESACNTADRILQVAFLNQATGQFEVVGFAPNPLTDGTYQVDVTSDPSRFVNPSTGEVLTRVTFIQTNSRPLIKKQVDLVDLVAWEVEL